MDVAAATTAQGPRHSGAVIVGIFVVAFIAVGLGVAAYLKVTPHPLAINSILADLRKYDGQTVTIQGTVKDEWNVGGMKWYKLEDPTGGIMVVTDRGLPGKGKYVLVTGQVKEVVKIMGINYTVILEAQPPS